MSHHPNRSRRRKTPGHNPKPADIRRLREEMELTQTAFGTLLYSGLSTVQAWEDGTRRMPGLTWEYINLLWGFREVARAREIWLTGVDIRFPMASADADDYDAALSETLAKDRQ